MDAKKVDSFMLEKGKCFPADKTMYVKEKLMETGDQRSYVLETIPLKNPITMLVISICLGAFGVDRFMNGDIGLGILKLCTLGGLGFWWIADIFILPKKVKEYNFSKFMTMI